MNYRFSQNRETNLALMRLLFQVMAIATLAEVYNNPDVFRGVVKIRKGLACRVILESGTFDGVSSWFYKLTKQIRSRIPPSDPSATQTGKACMTATKLTEASAGRGQGSSFAILILLSLPAVLFACVYCYRR